MKIGNVTYVGKDIFVLRRIVLKCVICRRFFFVLRRILLCDDKRFFFRFRECDAEFTTQTDAIAFLYPTPLLEIFSFLGRHQNDGLITSC